MGAASPAPRVICAIQRNTPLQGGLGGIYIIRTSLGPEDMAAGECVRN